MNTSKSLIACSNISLLLALVAIGTANCAVGANFDDQTTGNWNLGNTWGNSGNNTAGSGYPTGADTITKNSNVNITVTQNESFSGGTWNNGNIIINDAQTLTLLSGTFAYNGGDRNLEGSDSGTTGGKLAIANGATFSWTNGNRLEIFNEVVIENSGTFSFAAADARTEDGPLIFINNSDGLLQATGGSDTNSGLKSGGSFRNLGGDISLVGGADLDITNGGQANLGAGVITNTSTGGDLSLSAGSVLELSGYWENLIFDTASTTGTARSTDTMTFAPNATLDVPGTGLTYEEDHLRFDTSTATDVFTQAGVLTLQKSGKIELKDEGGGTGGGTLTWNNTGHTISRSTVGGNMELQLDLTTNIQNSGIWEFDSDANDDGTADGTPDIRLQGSSFTNTGIVRKTGVGDSDVQGGGDFDNAGGTLEVLGGELQFNSGVDFTLGGSAPGSTLSDVHIRVIDSDFVNTGNTSTLDLQDGAEILAIGSSASLTLSGDARLENNGADLTDSIQTVAGGLFVNNGHLLELDNSTGNLFIQSGGVLGGDGGIVRLNRDNDADPLNDPEHVQIQSGGTLSPGDNNFGTLTIDDDLTMDTGSIYQFDVQSALAPIDLTDVAGTLTLDDDWILKLVGTLTDAEVEAGLDRVLFDYGADGGIDETPTFDLSMLTANNAQFDVTNDTINNQVLLNISSAAVPEPASLAIWTLLGLLAAGYAWRRRAAA